MAIAAKRPVPSEGADAPEDSAVDFVGAVTTRGTDARSIGAFELGLVGMRLAAEQ